MNTIFRSAVCSVIPEYNYNENKYNTDDDVSGSYSVCHHQHNNSVVNDDSSSISLYPINRNENKSEVYYDTGISTTSPNERQINNSELNDTLQDAFLSKDSIGNQIENRSDINYEIDEPITLSCHLRKSNTSVINDDDLDETDLVPPKLKANNSRIKKMYKRIKKYCKGKIINKKKVVKNTDEKIHHSSDDININIESNICTTIDKEDNDNKNCDIIYREDANFVNDDINNDSSNKLENKNKKKVTKYKFKKYVLKMFKRPV